MMMASFSITPNPCIHRLQSPSPSHITPIFRGFSNDNYYHWRNRGSSVITRGGAPGATTYLFAFIFPLSLLAVTIFTSIKISDKLDKDFYQELEVNQSILEAADYDDKDVVPSTDQVDAPPSSRTRNRPKRQVEVSGR